MAWATVLRTDPFVNARIRLTFLYIGSVVVVLAITNVLIFKIDLSTLYLLIIVTVALISYFISEITLSPIRHILRAQKRFIADASHELRTPLAIMKTNAEVALLDGARLDPHEAVSILKSTVEEIDRMSGIIENLLALSYYDNRFTEIPLSPVNLATMVTNITKRAESLALTKGVNMRVVYTDPGAIKANPIAIEQLVINLLKNAVTYTPTEGQVNVSVTNRGDIMELKIKDSGIGIPEKDLPFVFSPFYKAGQARTPHEKGSSGLGLTIVRKIVERHKGSIYLNSKEGKGTTVSIFFPRLISS